jgi:hypothetical protein
VCSIRIGSDRLEKQARDGQTWREKRKTERFSI